MHSVSRGLKGLQNAAVRPCLSIKSRVTSAPWEAVRRHSVDDFVQSTLVAQEGVDPEQREGKPKRYTTGPFLPRTAQVVAAPTTPAVQINKSTKPDDDIGLPNTVYPKPFVLKRPRPQKARPPKDPNSLVRHSPVRGREDEKKASVAPSGGHQHPRVVHFEALPAGTGPQHVLKALNRALVAGDLAAKTAVVTAAELLLPSGAVRVQFLYADGAREACLLARAGRLLVRGVPASAQLQEEVSDEEHKEAGRRASRLGDNAAAAAVAEVNAGAKATPPPPRTLDPRMRGADVSILTESQRAAMGLRSKSPLMMFRGREERVAAGLGVSSVESGNMRQRRAVPAVPGVKGKGVARGPDGTCDDVLPAGAEEGEKHVPKVASAFGAEIPAAALGQSG